ncbi:hypothetical protein SAMN06295967_109114 [Belliella buryatensis]|uniref:Uncharacterized protein n=1 Tax=Belliella buryatensis TaxID=1500549 RepID=A0A239EFK9_9BACT|nr:hypothetical protein [Belliella buryatensis]SNS43211.1 hypothetical protein SAMN06295967_109114 [Belliella buryatensis]
MNTTVLTQKNVCAFLGLIMALTIVWTANAQGATLKGEQANEIAAMEELKIADQQEMLVEIDLSNIKQEPTATFINKHGEVVAEFYGDKAELEQKFKGLFRKCDFITASGNHEFYLVS